METTKKLIMSFLTSDDRKVSLSVDNPREDITETEIKSAMDFAVLATAIFCSGNVVPSALCPNAITALFFIILFLRFV